MGIDTGLIGIGAEVGDDKNPLRVVLYITKFSSSFTCFFYKKKVMRVDKK